MSTYDQVIQRWLDRCLGSDKRQLNNPRMPINGDKIYSYGHWFELARPLRTKKGKVRGFLLNGDTYSNTTTKHQAHVRSAVSTHPHVIIPYSALAEAGVDMDSIQIVHTLPDRSERKVHTTTEMPEGAKWITHDTPQFVDLTPEELETKLAMKVDWERRNWEQRVKLHEERPGAFRDPGEFKPPVMDDLQSWQRREWRKTGTRTTLHTSSSEHAPEIIVMENTVGDKLYQWETFHHWLGESLIRARVGWSELTDDSWTRHHRWAYFLSGFDHQERVPLYFFCELPYRAKPTTVAEAYQILKPDPVLLAEQMGRKVSRQGDIFAVPVPSLDRKTLKAKGARFEKRGYILNTNHTATEVAYLPGGLTLAKGLLYHDPAGRQPDHARRKMGDGAGWHVVTKNTVPVAGRR